MIDLSYLEGSMEGAAAVARAVRKLLEERGLWNGKETSPSMGEPSPRQVLLYLQEVLDEVPVEAMVGESANTIFDRARICPGISDDDS